MYAFKSKAQTLAFLAGKVKLGSILPLLTVKTDELKARGRELAVTVLSKMPKGRLIVRSSSSHEDSAQESLAGHFKSVLNVKPTADDLHQAMLDVLSSYGKSAETEDILIQPMLEDIDWAGVVFTADLDALTPYYIVNYDDTGNSESVTSGKTAGTKSYIHFKNSPVPCPDKRLRALFEACAELETLLECTYLDIEFAFDKKGAITIFQVRPIAMTSKEDLSNVPLEASLRKIHKKVEKLSAPHPNLLGDKVIFGVMPDWNPAEMIGLKPQQLAMSLYKELITDNVWAYQRDNYGYRNLRSHPLMVSLLGVPFIDVRVDFNSFVPKSLDEGIAKKLVDHYLKKLDSSPTHHDKVEFEIVHSCYYLNLPAQLKALSTHGFMSGEIKRIEKALLKITNAVIDPEEGLYKKDLERIEVLQRKYQDIVGSELSVMEKIYWLVADCKRYGTLPFAGVARAAFIAIQFLKSFVHSGVMSEADYEGFMNSLRTVAKRLNGSLTDLQHGKIAKPTFLAEYGHLRPGTYDILSPRYDENFETYFADVRREYAPDAPKKWTFSKKQQTLLNGHLKKHGIQADSASLIRFIQEAIEGREQSKFLFTRSVSEILRLVESLGALYGISRHDLAYLDIKTVLGLYATLDHRDVKDILQADIDKNKEFYRYTKAVKLPALIRNADDVYSFPLDSEDPTFITLKRVEAEIVTENEFQGGHFENKIVFIRSADPGYDFLFTKNIRGLVTQFGGANSHMAVRCAELGLPAVIGAGEKNYKDWSKATVLEIDSVNKQVRVIA